jgi:DNA-binding LacI/PurR family transcriptional regulator
MGHRRICYVTGPTWLYVANERLEGYRRGLAETGIELDPALIVESTFDQAGGAAAVDTLISRKIDFTAITCANDLLAIGAMTRLQQLGIAVPGDVSVAGYDDIAVAALTTPALSTVRVPLRDLGRRAFEYAVDLLATQPQPPIELPTELVLRESTAPPPAIPWRGDR